MSIKIKYSILDLEDYLQVGNPYPCLNILESAVACCQNRRISSIPTALLEDIASIFGVETVEKEIRTLERMSILKSSEEGFSLNEEAFHPINNLIKKLIKDLKITLINKEETVVNFMKNLVSYLERQVPDLVVAEIVDEIEYMLIWDGTIYQLKLAFSPAWLPVAAEEAALKKSYYGIFGPFAAQNWQRMFSYYRYPEFRNFTAYYDPWYHQKMNISKGGLFSYFDWFFRDIYHLKFTIPDEFTKELQNQSLIRYNDEK